MRKSNWQEKLNELQVLPFTLEDHVVVGNILKLLHKTLTSAQVNLALAIGKTNARKTKEHKLLKDTNEHLDTLKNLMEQLMFRDYPGASDDYLKAYYGISYEKLPDNLNNLKKLTGLG